jgi:murein DD-endopeptidase MepM/ murein hydrolase activator NlpD
VTPILAALATLVLSSITWIAPVAPLVVERPFSSPSGPYSPGHRGVDLAATPGTAVRAPAPGIVRVAGRVAGKDIVSIEHPHRILGRTGWRTTYEGVRATVQVGDRVDQGDRIGSVAGSGGHTDGLHWGLKLGKSYADPLLLLRHAVILKPLSLTSLSITPPSLTMPSTGNS